MCPFLLSIYRCIIWKTKISSDNIAEISHVLKIDEGTIYSTQTNEGKGSNGVKQTKMWPAYIKRKKERD